MTGGCSGDCDQLEARVADLEKTLKTLRVELITVTNRDIPLVKGTIRSIVATDVETMEELPDAGWSFREEIDDVLERLETVEQQIEALGDVSDEPSTKQEKHAAVLAFAANKHANNGKVSVSPTEIKGCTGVSRRYAYDLIEAIAEDVTGVTLREAKRVQMSSGTQRKGKALLVDCEFVRRATDGVNQFTTGDATEEGRD